MSKVKKNIENVKPSLCVLYSRLAHDVTIQYGVDLITIPPRGQARKLNKEKLGAIPKGVVLKMLV